LYSWGTNNDGQLGQNNVIDRSSPVQVGAQTDWSQVSAGQKFCAAVKTNGTLWSWGLNTNGQLGQNSTIRRSSPVQVGALTDWSQVAAGYNFCTAIKTNGTLWSWGSNGYGVLGLNIATTINRSSPVQVGALTDWSQVSAGAAICVAVKTNGTLWSWGQNQAGSIGQNIAYTISRSSPVQVGALTDWTQVSAGSNCLAIKTDGTLWSWGGNAAGQLGQIDTIDRSSPVQIGSLTDWSQISSGDDFSTAVKTTGTLWSWGLNTNGQLGQNSTIRRSSPVQVGALTDWSQVSAGPNFCISVKTTGTLWSWGDNGNGQLGQNIAVATDRSSPVQVGALTTWSSIGQGCIRTHNVAILN
jgi:alpha-tubulin suppressor-like RCC1 family protein